MSLYTGRSGAVTMGCCGAVLGGPHDFGCTDGAPCPDCDEVGGHTDDCPAGTWDPAEYRYAVLLAQAASSEAHLAFRGAA